MDTRNCERVNDHNNLIPSTVNLIILKILHKNPFKIIGERGIVSSNLKVASKKSAPYSDLVWDIDLYFSNAFRQEQGSPINIHTWN